MNCNFIFKIHRDIAFQSKVNVAKHMKSRVPNCAQSKNIFVGKSKNHSYLRRVLCNCDLISQIAIQLRRLRKIRSFNYNVCFDFFCQITLNTRFSKVWTKHGLELSSSYINIVNVTELYVVNITKLY